MPPWPFLPAQDPVTIAPPGIQSLGQSSAAAEHGEAWNPDHGDGATPFMRVPMLESVAGSVMPIQDVPRPAGRMRHPAAPTGSLRSTDWNEFGGTSGLHAEFVAGVSTPTGQSEGWSPMARTFRMTPDPYDQNVYVGWVPDQPTDH